jgi:hypothetical protein
MEISLRNSASSALDTELLCSVLSRRIDFNAYFLMACWDGLCFRVDCLSDRMEFHG